MLEDARHALDLGRLPGALLDEHGEDQLARLDGGLADEAAHGRGGAQAARAVGWEHDGHSLVGLSGVVEPVFSGPRVKPGSI
ncbi:hypothetical protein GCM10009634_25230 [Saccharothrix xinjiangensis]